MTASGDRRQTRLESEYHRLLDLRSRSDFIDLEALEGTPPKRYRIAFKCKGLMLHPSSGQPCVTVNHVMEAYLPTGYPAEPPYIRWMTPIFHPNISKAGSVCIGIADQDWAPSLSLAWLVEQIADMITYKSFNIDDPWNREAADWAKDNIDRFPVDDRPLFKTSEAKAVPLKEKSAARTSQQPRVQAKPQAIEAGMEDEPAAEAKPAEVRVLEVKQGEIRVARVRSPKPKGE